MSKTVMTDKARVASVSMDMRLYVTILVAAVLWAMILPPGAGAECRWEWLCDDSGMVCQRGAVCDSVQDVMPPPPAEVEPVVTPSVAPPPKPGRAPEGATDCRQVRRCDIQGSCIWDTLCVCL